MFNFSFLTLASFRILFHRATCTFVIYGAKSKLGIELIKQDFHSTTAWNITSSHFNFSPLSFLLFLFFHHSHISFSFMVSHILYQQGTRVFSTHPYSEYRSLCGKCVILYRFFLNIFDRTVFFNKQKELDSQELRLRYH